MSQWAVGRDPPLHLVEGVAKGRLRGGCSTGAYPVERVESLLDGIASAFQYFGGVTGRVVLDNTSLAVKQVLAGRGRAAAEATALQGWRLVVTTNPPFACWSEVFLDPTATAAVIDRFFRSGRSRSPSLPAGTATSPPPAGRPAFLG